MYNLNRKENICKIKYIVCSIHLQIQKRCVYTGSYTDVQVQIQPPEGLPCPGYDGPKQGRTTFVARDL